jgi:hypothetical protein
MDMKVKPILKISIPVKGLSDERVDELIDSYFVHLEHMEELKEQYFVFIFTDRENDNVPKFEVFYDKDFDEISYKKFQEAILKEIKNK